MLICDAMRSSSENSNTMSRGVVPLFARDAKKPGFYNRNMGMMPRHDWFIRDWLSSTGISQTDLQRRAGWSKRKASDIMNGGRYNRDIINDAAHALNVEPYELLLHPHDAMEIRQLRKSLRLVAERRRDYNAETGADNFEDKGPDRRSI